MEYYADVNLEELAQKAASGVPIGAHVEYADFGGRAADQMNAFLAEGNEGKVSRPKVSDDKKRAQAATASDYHEKLAAMDFDERVKATKECILRRSTFRDILYNLLGFCLEEKSYEEIEPYVESFENFHRNNLNQRRYVYFLLRAGGLEEIELGEDGQPVTEEMKQAAIDEGLDPDDVDTLVFDWRVVTTEAGRKAYEDFDPRKRIEQAIAQDREHEEAFVTIMSFCTTPQYGGTIIDTFRGKDFLGFNEENRLPIQPSAYIDKLDRAGALSWDGNTWSLTDAGREFLVNRAS